MRDAAATDKELAAVASKVEAVEAGARVAAPGLESGDLPGEGMRPPSEHAVRGARAARCGARRSVGRAPTPSPARARRASRPPRRDA